MNIVCCFVSWEKFYNKKDGLALAIDLVHATNGILLSEYLMQPMQTSHCIRERIWQNLFQLWILVTILSNRLIMLTFFTFTRKETRRRHSYHNWGTRCFLMERNFLQKRCRSSLEVVNTFTNPNAKTG